MATLQPAQVISRSNSDLLNIDRVSHDTTLTPAQRMALIARIIDGWDRSTSGTTARHTAARVLSRYWDNGIRRGA